MSSASLQRWQSVSMIRLAHIEAQCIATTTLAPPNPELAEENLRAFVLLLSSHFQGFCRELYTECTQVFAISLSAAMQPTIQAQFSAELKVNGLNPTAENIRKDFERFAFQINFDADPKNAPRITQLGHLNKWRKSIAHHSVTPPAGIPALTFANVQGWKSSCDGLAIWLNSIMFTELSRILGAPPC